MHYKIFSIYQRLRFILKNLHNTNIFYYGLSKGRTFFQAPDGVIASPSRCSCYKSPCVLGSCSIAIKQTTYLLHEYYSQQSNILHGHLQFSTSNKQALSSSITTIHVILFPLTRRSRSSLNKQSVLSPSSLRLRNQFSFVPPNLNLHNYS